MAGRLASVFLKEQSPSIMEGMAPLYDKQKYLDTGARIVAWADIQAKTERRGQWDQDSGRIVYEDGAVEVSAVVGPAVCAAKPKKTEKAPQPPAPEPKPDPKPEPPPVARKAPHPERFITRHFDPLNDPRRATVLALYKAGLTVEEVAKHDEVRMKKENVSAILHSAGIERRRGKPTKGKPKRPRAKVDPTNHPKAAEVIQAYERGHQAKKVAKDLEISDHTVRAILRAVGKLRNRGAHWRPDGTGFLPTWKITPAVAEEIRSSSETGASLAKRLGVSPSTISRVRTEARKAQSAAD